MPFATVLLFLRAGGRVELSGPEEIVDPDPAFRVHFTRAGADAPPDVDADGNGLPDLVDAVSAQLLVARDAYAAEGWRALVGDDGEDGTDAIDVYVHDIEDYGFAVPEPASDGASCWLSVDPSIGTGAVARSVVSHELHHCVEFRYRDDLATWLYEGAATYEQYTHVTDPALDLASGILYLEQLAAPGSRLASTDGRLEYAKFLFMKHWAERGDASLVALWEHLAENDDGWQVALDRASQDAHGLPLDELYLDFAAWNAFACGEDDGAHYDPTAVPCVVDASVPVTAWDGAEIGVALDEAPLAAAYLELPATDGEVTVQCEGPGAPLVAVIPRDADRVGGDAATGASGEPVTARGRGGPVTVVVAGTGENPLSATCRTLASAEAPPDTGCGCASGAMPGGGAALVLLALGRRRSGRA